MVVKNTEEYIKKIQGIGTPVKDQIKLLDLNIKEPKIKRLIFDFINKYENFKTILNLQELFSSSNVTRTKSIPRAQNKWDLFRKNVSKGLHMTVGETSGIASYLWSIRSEEEKQFWSDLCLVTKEIHAIDSFDMDVSDLNIKKGEENFCQDSLMFNDITDTKTDYNYEFDIEMLDENLFQTDSILFDPIDGCDNKINDQNLYDSLLNDQAFLDIMEIDPTFSYIDPTLINN
ncbi:9946_t:CDS:2 [Rhizophagus irregularis]|nr:9946_t:CDS:2 [Rhizophagus irregularis]